MQVFEHGQLRLYLLALLADGPRHGYDVIRALEDRFEGLYSPSAGTVYPRLAKLEEEGLVERTDEGRKALYRITDAGRAEVAARAGEIDDLQVSLDASAARLAADMRDRVHSGAADLRTQLEQAARQARAQATDAPQSDASTSAASSTQGPWPFGAKVADDVWSRVTDHVADSGSPSRLGVDIEGLLRQFGGGRFPDADTVAQALRRMTQPPQHRQAEPENAQGDPAGPEAETVSEAWAEAPRAAPTAQTPDEVVDAEIVEEPTSAPPHGEDRTDDERHPPHGDPGFPTPAQVKEIVAILRDAGTRIQAVLKEPRA